MSRLRNSDLPLQSVAANGIITGATAMEKMDRFDVVEVVGFGTRASVRLAQPGSAGPLTLAAHRVAEASEGTMALVDWAFIKADPEVPLQPGVFLVVAPGGKFAPDPGVGVRVGQVLEDGSVFLRPSGAWPPRDEVPASAAKKGKA